MGINPRLSDLKGSGTSKMDWRYLEHNKIDRKLITLPLQSKTGVHLLNGELTQLLTPNGRIWNQNQTRIYFLATFVRFYLERVENESISRAKLVAGAN